MADKRNWWAVAGGTLLAVVLFIVATTTLAPPSAVSSPGPAVLWDTRLTLLKAGIAPAACYDKPHFRIIEAWVTLNGNWSDPAIPAVGDGRPVGGDHAVLWQGAGHGDQGGGMTRVLCGHHVDTGRGCVHETAKRGH